MKKTNIEENDPNLFEDEEDYEDQDAFLDFFKDSKAKKPLEKEPKELLPKGNFNIPARIKSFEEPKNEKKPFELYFFPNLYIIFKIIEVCKNHLLLTIIHYLFMILRKFLSQKCNRLF